MNEQPESRTTMDYMMHEADMARMERVNKRLWIALLVVIALFTLSNAAWIYHENQFINEVTITQESDAKDGGTAIVNNSGDLTYGEITTDNN